MSHAIPLPPAVDSPYRVEANLWGRSIECSALEDEPPEEIYTLTKPARECPDEPAYVEIAFDRGVPAAINGVAMPMLELIASLGTIASAHGVGRIDVVEHRVGSARLREVGEAPAAVLLHAAHKELRKISAPRELERFSRTVSAEYADIIYGGLWFSPLRAALDAFVEVVQRARQRSSSASNCSKARTRSSAPQRRRRPRRPRSFTWQKADDNALVGPLRCGSGCRGARMGILVQFRSPPVRGRRHGKPGLGAARWRKRACSATTRPSHRRGAAARFSSAAAPNSGADLVTAIVSVPLILAGPIAGGVYASRAGVDYRRVALLGAYMTLPIIVTLVAGTVANVGRLGDPRFDTLAGQLRSTIALSWFLVALRLAGWPLGAAFAQGFLAPESSVRAEQTPLADTSTFL